MSEDKIPVGPSKIIINLNNSREAASLKKDEIIQQEALKQFEKLILQIKKRIPSFKDQLACNTPIRSVRTHDVITIDGRRGSGKTTFVLSGWQSLDGEIKNSICFLDIIDPTLIETCEHVFVTIISIIKKRVEDVINNPTHQLDEGYVKAWRSSLLLLARGLTLLDGVGGNHMKSDSWMDEHFVLEHGIQNAQSGKDLEQSFHKYINQSLSLIGKEAFLIAFDDIDTDFSKGWPVLEILRKYLTTPQLITVLSGDLQLYSTLVEKNQRKNLGTVLKAQNGEQRFQPIIEGLVDQYLLKILKPSHRIELRTTGYYQNNDKYEIEVLKSDKNESFNLYLILESICSQVMFIRNRTQKQEAINLLLETPTRTIVSLLCSMEEHFTDNWKGLRSKREEAIFVLYDIFLHWIHRFSILRSDLEQENLKKILSIILERFIERELLPKAAPLKAIFSDKGTSFAMLTLGASISNSMAQKPRGYIDYMVRTALPARAISDLSSDLFWDTTNTDALRTISTKNKTEFYFKHLGVIDGETTLNVARKHISAMWPTSYGTTDKKMAILNGSIQLSRTATASNIFGYLYRNPAIAENKSIFKFKNGIAEVFKTLEKEYSERDFFNTQDTLSSNITSWHKYLAMFPISHNRSNDSTYTHFSFYNLIACIPRLIDSIELQQDFESISFVRDYFVMQQSDNRTKSNNDTSIKTVIDEESYELSELFKDNFSKWIEKGGRLQRYSVHTHIVYKAWTRLYYAIKRIPEYINKDRNQDQSLAGSILHRWIVIFLNSILVEESASYQFNNIKYNNPITSDQIFIHNVEQVYKKRKSKGGSFDFTRYLPSHHTELKLFEWLFSCPIWSYFLDSDSPVFQRHKQAMIYNQIIDEDTPIEEDLRIGYNGMCLIDDEKSITLHDCLNSLAIIGMTKPQELTPQITTHKSKYMTTIEQISTYADVLSEKWEQNPQPSNLKTVKFFLKQYAKENSSFVMPRRITENSMKKVHTAFNEIILKD